MKFIEFIKRHCFLVVSLIIIIIILIGGFIVAKNLFFSNGGDVFGNRLEGIEEHQITSDELNNIQTELEKLENVVSISNNIVGRRADFIIKVTAETDLITSKGVADKILEFLAEDKKSYYDIQVMITSEDEENQDYPVIGYKHKSKVGFNW